MATHKPQGKMAAKSTTNDSPTSTSEPILFPSVEYIGPVYHSRVPRRTSSPTPLVLEKMNEKDFPVSHYLTRSVMRQCHQASAVPHSDQKKQKRRFTRIVYRAPKASKKTTVNKTTSRDMMTKTSPNRKESQVKSKISTLSSHAENKTSKRASVELSAESTKGNDSSPTKQDASSKEKKSGLVRKVKEVASRVKQSFQTSAEKKKSEERGQTEVKQMSGVQRMEIGSEVLKDAGTTKKQHFSGATTENLDVSLHVTCFGRGKVQLKKAQSPAKTQNLVRRRRRVLWVPRNELPEVSTPLKPRPLYIQQKENDVTEVQTEQTTHDCRDLRPALGSSTCSSAESSSSAVGLPEWKTESLQQRDNTRQNEKISGREELDEKSTSLQQQENEKIPEPVNETSRQDLVVGEKSAPSTVLIDRTSSFSNVKSYESQREVSSKDGSSDNTGTSSEQSEQFNTMNPTNEQSGTLPPPSSDLLNRTFTLPRTSCELNAGASLSQPSNVNCKPLMSPRTTITTGASSGIDKGLTSPKSSNTPGYRRKSLTTNEFRAALSSILLRRERIILMLRRLGVPDTFITSDKLCTSHLDAVLKEKLSQVQTDEEKTMCIQLMNHFSAARAVKQNLVSVKKLLMSENPISSPKTHHDVSKERSELPHSKQSATNVPDVPLKVTSSTTTNQSFDPQTQSVRPTTRVQDLQTTSGQRKDCHHIQNQDGDCQQPDVCSTIALPPKAIEDVPNHHASEPMPSTSLNVSRKPKPTPRQSLVSNVAGQNRPESSTLRGQEELNSTQIHRVLKTPPVPVQRQSVTQPTVAAPVLPSAPTVHINRNPPVLPIQSSVTVSKPAVQASSHAVSQKPSSHAHQVTASFPIEHCPSSTVPIGEPSDNAKYSSDNAIPIAVAQKPPSVTHQSAQPEKIVYLSDMGLQRTTCISASSGPLPLTTESSSTQRPVTCSDNGQRVQPLMSAEHRPSMLSSFLGRSGTQNVSVATTEVMPTPRPPNHPACPRPAEEQHTLGSYTDEKHLAIPSIVKGREVARDLSDFVANIPLDAVTEVEASVRKANPETHANKKRCVVDTEPEINAEATCKRARVESTDQQMNRLLVDKPVSPHVPSAADTVMAATPSISDNLIVPYTRTVEPDHQEGPASNRTQSGALQGMSASSRCETCIISWKLLSMYPYHFYCRTVTAESILGACLPSPGNVNVDGMDDAMLRQELSLMLRVGRHYGWKPHLYARDLVFRLFTVGELKNRVFRTLDPRKIVAIRQCINEKFRLNDFLFRVVCERFVNKAIRELFSTKLNYLMFEIEAHSAVHRIGQQVASVVAAVTNSS